MDSIVDSAALRRRREELGLSPQLVAEAAGVQSGLLRDLERALGSVSFTTMAKIADVLGISLDMLVTRRGLRTLIPRSLETFALQEGLSAQEVLELAQVRWHGQRPYKVEDWRLLWLVLRRVVRPGAGGSYHPPLEQEAVYEDENPQPHAT